VDHHKLEEGNELMLDFDKLNKVVASGERLVPVVTQDVKTGTVLILAYANKEALRVTLETKLATFWSSSRNELWVKGLGSGNALKVEAVLVNCEQNSLLYRVRLEGEGACHTQDATGKARLSCYYREIKDDGSGLSLGKYS
tara:strand:- start:1486 stop:1908 length:423 start_codon:yes stop_codon:yes gene_type:complete